MYPLWLDFHWPSMDGFVCIDCPPQYSERGVNCYSLQRNAIFWKPDNQSLFPQIVAWADWTAGQVVAQLSVSNLGICSQPHRMVANLTQTQECHINAAAAAAWRAELEMCFMTI